MRKFLIAIFAAFPIAVAAQLSVPATVDFGRINEVDGPKTVIAYIKNIGAETNSISRVRPGCGCTAVDFDKGEIAPGDSARMELRYDPRHRPGRFEKSVKVFPSEGESERITITGVVMAAPETLDRMYQIVTDGLRVSETNLTAGALKPGEVKTVFVEVYNPTEETVRIEVDNPYDDVKIELYPEDVEPAERGMVAFSLMPGMNPEDFASPRKFTLRQSSPSLPTIETEITVIPNP